MNKAIGGDAALPPPRGRRIPAVGSGKDNGEDRPNARDLLASVNSASSGASTSWIAFIGTMAYLAVTLGGITHVDLLLNNDTTLPFVTVKVPLATFFVMAPLAFVLVHFGLLLQHGVLSRKLRAFEERLWKEHPTRNRREQPIRDELHSYSFAQAASGMPKGAAVDVALRLVMSLTLVVFPLLLLTFFQIGFLPYHSEAITWWHRGMLLVDVGVVVVLARYLARRDRETKVALTNWWHGTSAFKARLIVSWRRKFQGWRLALSRAFPAVRGRPIVVGTIRPVLTAVGGSGTVAMRALAPNRIMIGALVFFSMCVATLPDTAWDPLDQWLASLPIVSEPVPYCRPLVVADGKVTKRCPDVTGATRRAFYLTALLFERAVNDTTGKSDSVLGWSRNLIVTDKRLVGDDKKETQFNLRGRDFRFATLDRSHLKGSDFYGAYLGGAHLFETDLSAANFRTASLQGADLRRASLQGADLRWASLQGAGLSGASLQGADLSSASLQGADLGVASLQGADLRWASLQGADLRWASLQGADLDSASLQGADLFAASLQGADLGGASLQGADLSGASLQGARLTRASLQGADLREAKLQGADLGRVRLWMSGMARGAAAWELLSFAATDIRRLDDAERRALDDTIAALEALQAAMTKEGTPGRERVGGTAKRVVYRTSGLLETRHDEQWRLGEDARGWCKLTRRPPPEPAKVSTYLGTLACDDDTDKAFMAQRLIGRVLFGLRFAPNSLLEAFKGCPAFARLPPDLKSRLERAAQVNKENAAKRAANPEKTEQATPPQPPKICEELSKAKPAKR